MEMAADVTDNIQMVILSLHLRCSEQRVSLSTSVARVAIGVPDYFAERVWILTTDDGIDNTIVDDSFLARHWLLHVSSSDLLVHTPTIWSEGQEIWRLAFLRARDFRIHLSA